MAKADNRRDLAFENRILRLQLTRDHALLLAVYEWADTAPAFPADVKAEIAEALDAGNDALEAA